MTTTTTKAQCECCKDVIEWDDVEYVNDSYSDNTVALCRECNTPESYINYKGETA
jgi:hypothetical protein